MNQEQSRMNGQKMFYIQQHFAEAVSEIVQLVNTSTEEQRAEKVTLIISTIMDRQADLLRAINRETFIRIENIRINTLDNFITQMKLKVKEDEDDDTEEELENMRSIIMNDLKSKLKHMKDAKIERESC
jgi:hypothetical protein